MAFTYKVLGQVAPADTNNANLYTVGSGKSAIVSTIHIANVTNAAVTARIFVRIAGATAGIGNALAYDVSIAANSLFALSEGITLAATDVVSVRSSVGNALTFTAFGSEIA
jgi:hypothetical protein